MTQAEFELRILFLFLTCMYVCACVNTHATRHLLEVRGQLAGVLLPSTTWVLGTELRLAGVVASAYSLRCLAVLRTGCLASASQVAYYRLGLALSALWLANLNKAWSLPCTGLTLSVHKRPL